MVSKQRARKGYGKMGSRIAFLKEAVNSSKECNPSYLTGRKIVFYWNKPEAVFMIAKIKLLITWKWFKNSESAGIWVMRSAWRCYVVCATSRCLGICLPSRWLRWESTSCIWFLESIKPPVKLLVLQSRGLREARIDENKNSFAVGTAEESTTRFYFNCIFQVFWSF